MTVIFNGIGVSRGISIGRVQILHHGTLDVVEVAIPKNLLNDEVKRLKNSLKLTKGYLQTIRASVTKKFPPDVASFIDSHLLMIKDATLNDDVVKIIQEQQCNAEWALQIQKERLLSVFEKMQDNYLRTRSDDIEQVVKLIQRFLLQQQDHPVVEHKDMKGCIIVADDLTPADTILLQHQNISGFITEFGGPTSHTIILARGLGIPAIVSAHSALSLLTENEEIIIDGNSGMIIADADQAVIQEYRLRQKEEKKRQSKLRLLLDKKTITRDGVPIILTANVELSEEVKMLKKSGAAGVGLYRTEFLYLDRQASAGENEQLQAYRRLLRAAEGHSVTIRTLDLGAEKDFDSSHSSSPAPNPALGLRAIRRSLKEPEVFLQQLRAILRASAYGSVRIMFPMLTSYSEIQQLKQLLEIAKTQLRQKKIKYDENIPVGGMIEVPGAALLASEFASHFDFLSIGTNDLIQYTLAIDRIDDEVSYLYDPLHPSVLKLIKMVIDACKRRQIPVSMCGEMAGDPKYIKLLIGMGLREFSSHISTLLEVKKIILDSDVSQLESKCKRILSTNPTKISKLVEAL